MAKEPHDTDELTIISLIHHFMYSKNKNVYHASCLPSFASSYYGLLQQKVPAVIMDTQNVFTLGPLMSKHLYDYASTMVILINATQYAEWHEW